jgi:hypothetical protein
MPYLCRNHGNNWPLSASRHWLRKLRVRASTHSVQSMRQRRSILSSRAASLFLSISLRFSIWVLASATVIIPPYATRRCVACARIARALTAASVSSSFLRARSPAAVRRIEALISLLNGRTMLFSISSSASISVAKRLICRAVIGVR